jgi:glycosyltransferase involved in cell wall biosynthesis
MSATTTTIVVPCFDEASRLDPGGLRQLACLAHARIHLVDDGSTDGTAGALAALVAADPATFAVTTFATNRGKAEAVRVGLLAALDDGAAIVGYYDADLATPPVEMARLVGVLTRDPTLEVVLGSRVALLGTAIDRSPPRHYVGRLFATASSLILDMTVYDTQCGAKVLRAGPALRAALETPFHSRWAFDVELLGRLHRGGGGVAGLPTSVFREEPLAAWHDRRGSKLGPAAALRAAWDLVAVARAVRAGR